MLKIKNGQALEFGQKVRVYRNLHKGMFSIQDYKTKKVIGYGDGLLLKDVNFKINKKGQERVRKTFQKNVHAFVIGTFVGEERNLTPGYTHIGYNPYITDQFIDLTTTKPIFQSKLCLCLYNKCYVK